MISACVPVIIPFARIMNSCYIGFGFGYGFIFGFGFGFRIRVVCKSRTRMVTRSLKTGLFVIGFGFGFQIRVVCNSDSGGNQVIQNIGKHTHIRTHHLILDPVFLICLLHVLAPVLNPKTRNIHTGHVSSIRELIDLPIALIVQPPDVRVHIQQYGPICASLPVPINFKIFTPAEGVIYL